MLKAWRAARNALHVSPAIAHDDDEEANASTKAKRIPVTKLFNRMLGLPIGHQELLFATFARAFTQFEAEARSKDAFDAGVLVLTGRSVVRLEQPTVVYEDPRTKHQLLANVVRVDRGMSFPEAIRFLRYRIMLHNVGYAPPKGFPKMKDCLLYTSPSPRD